MRRRGWLLGRGGRYWLLGRRVMDWFLGSGGRDCCGKLLAVQFTEKLNVMQQEHKTVLTTHLPNPSTRCQLLDLGLSLTCSEVREM